MNAVKNRQQGGMRGLGVLRGREGYSGNREARMGCTW